MKEFIKENWFKLLIGVGFVSLSFALVDRFVIYIPQQAREEQLAKTQKSESECANQASKLFKQLGYNEAIGAFDSYTNHWNRKLSRCFVLIHTGGINKDDGKFWTNKILTDTIENKTYGVNLTPPEGIDCEMYADGNKDSYKHCKSSSEFDDFVHPFMND